MALCRCLNGYHHPNPRRYIGYFEPVGYPNTSSICGRLNCNEPGYIWLTQNELDNFNQIDRVIKLPTASTKVKVQNGFIFLNN